MKIDFAKEIKEADLLIVALRENEELPPNLRQIDAVRFHVKKGMRKGEIAELTTNGLHPIAKIILVGAGSGSSSLERQEMGGLIATLLKGEKIAIQAPAEWISDLAFGLKLRSWQFTKYRTEKPPKQTVVFLSDKPFEKDALCQGVVMARELTVEPANHLDPEEFAKRCAALDGIEVQVFDEKEIEAMGANALLSVGKGSVHPPRLVVMRWNGGKKGQPPIALVGKGVCYDSGGINLKNKELVEMKFDKAGAAVVTGTILALAKQKAPVNVVGVIGLAENMPDGASLKPGDIITTLSKQTVEVVDTDYEGRLILADCLWYAQEKFSPSWMIDLGTLTPETIAPLADEYAGLYSEDEALVKSLYQAGIASGEKVWQLPMGPRFANQIRSDYADMRNMGLPGFGEGAAAAEFLKRFIKPGVKWAHLDIAGVAWTLEDYPLNAKGITGFGVRLLVEWIHEHHIKSAMF